MFTQLFLFELKYRLRRPAVYIYLFIAIVWSAFLFANGMVPAQEKEFTNAPAALALYAGIMSFFLMLMSAFFMGVALYRDIEHGTKEYYLSYPITKPGYFWGRFLGSFFFVALTGAAAMFGPWLGTQIGLGLHLQRFDRIGPSRFIYYWYPYWTIMLPNLFFTSCLFFGLVSVFRTAKVIYTGAMLLFLGYLIGNFFLNNIYNPAVVYLSDPFVFNGLRTELADWSPRQLNTSVVPLRGLLLQNRILWISVGLLGLLIPYWRFSFQRFFSAGRSGKIERDTRRPVFNIPAAGQLRIQFNGKYDWKVLVNLTKIELLNIIRDSYFWIILTSGFIFVGFMFLNGPHPFRVPDLPRTVFFMDAFYEAFMLFVFLIIVLYTGETVHRERLTRYQLINDTLPPPTWVLNAAKLISLLCLGVGLALTPVWLGLLTQLLKGYHEYNLSQYLSSELVTLIPRTTEFVLLAYGIHVAVGNKFLAHGIAISFYLALFGLTDFHYADYWLLLYSYVPPFWASDMDGLGHMVRPLLWYHLYWTLAGGALVVAASLLYARGTRTSVRENLRLARERFRGAARWGLISLVLGICAAGSYIYYNVSYRNEYLTPWERPERAAIVEKALKKYAALPLPILTRLQMRMDLFPEEQREETVASCTIANKGTAVIDSLLLDADGVEFSLYHQGKLLPYINPLYFHRARFSWFRPRQEPSDYRMYKLPAPLQKGDSMTLEVHSTLAFHGFQNGLYAAGLLHNGIATAGNLPAMGYDEKEELDNNDTRREHGLSLKKSITIPQDDPTGKYQLNNGALAGLVPTDITISAPADHWAVAPGRLDREWTEQGRHYFHYIQDHPAVYMPFAILAARYSRLTDTVQFPGRVVPVFIAYHPSHYLNLPHFKQAIKDGLHYYSQAFGAYPFTQLSMVETSAYGPGSISLPGIMGLSEPRGGWVADLRGNTQPDNVYFLVAAQVARQWWGQQVMGNRTVGAEVIAQALPGYAALRMMKQKYGRDAVAPVYDRMLSDYKWGRRTNWTPNEAPLLYGNSGFISREKGTLILYGLAELIGEDSVNAALADFLRQWGLKDGGPYPGANDLYAVLKARTPDSLHYYLEDTWEKVVLYDNKVGEAILLPRRKDSAYHVRIHVDIGKSQYDAKNEAHEVAGMNDLVDVGIFGEAKNNGAAPLIRVYTARFTPGAHVIGLSLPERPAFVQVDPYHKLLDVRPEDNRKVVETTP